MCPANENLEGVQDTASVEITVASCRRVRNEIRDVNDDERLFELTQELCTDGTKARAYVRTSLSKGDLGELLIPGLAFAADATTIVGSAGDNGQQVIEGSGTAVVEEGSAPLPVQATASFQMCLDPFDVGPAPAIGLRAAATKLSLRQEVLAKLLGKALSSKTTQCLTFGEGVISYTLEADATLEAHVAWSVHDRAWVVEGTVPGNWDGALPIVDPLGHEWRCPVGTVCN